MLKPKFGIKKKKNMKIDFTPSYRMTRERTQEEIIKSEEYYHQFKIINDFKIMIKAIFEQEKIKRDLIIKGAQEIHDKKLWRQIKKGRIHGKNKKTRY